MWGVRGRRRGWASVIKAAPALHRETLPGTEGAVLVTRSGGWGAAGGGSSEGSWRECGAGVFGVGGFGALRAGA